LPARRKRKVFARLGGNLGPAPVEALTHSGFRRSQSIAYRPACEGCSACVSVRIRCGDFQISRSQKRILRRGAGLCAPKWRRRPRASNSRCCAPIWIHAIPARHERHGPVRLCRHGGRDAGNTHIVEYRKAGNGALVACALTDRLRDGSAWSTASFIRRGFAESWHLHDLDHVRAAQQASLPLYIWAIGCAAATRWTTDPLLAAGSLDQSGWELLKP